MTESIIDRKLTNFRYLESVLLLLLPWFLGALTIFSLVYCSCKLLKITQSIIDRKLTKFKTVGIDFAVAAITLFASGCLNLNKFLSSIILVLSYMKQL